MISTSKNIKILRTNKTNHGEVQKFRYGCSDLPADGTHPISNYLLKTAKKIVKERKNKLKLRKKFSYNARIAI